MARLTILVALAVFIVLLFQMPGSWTINMRQAGQNVVSPLVLSINRGANYVHKFQKGWSTLVALEQENNQLISQNAKLATENTVLKDMADENARLREMLGFKKATQYRLLAARLVARDPSNWWGNILINRGYADDDSLHSDLPVVTARGVVGKTGTVSRSVTEVILMSNQNCKVSALVENSREQGILVGDGNRDNGQSRCRLTYVSRTAQVSIGERVFTSGLGGVFPSGLLMGTVSEVPPLSPSVNFGLYREVYVDPVVDLAQLSEMFVVLEAPDKEGAATK